jgi:hypothetical protein
MTTSTTTVRASYLAALSSLSRAEPVQTRAIRFVSPARGLRWRGSKDNSLHGLTRAN